MPQGRTKFLYPSGSTPLEGYTIKRGIGVGGFGEVYFAISDAGKEVALKRILRNLDIELRGVRQCLNLKHVNLISLWDIRSDQEGESWVVMEYVPGKSLREMLGIYHEGLPEDQVKIWFASIAAGVACLHEKGIVHRDLKPGNVFCDDDEQVIKIGDYGLSKFISSQRSGQTESVGTFHYMAPEIGKGVYGKEIDIYAMGIILFELLTGDTPYDGESGQEIMMKHLTAAPDLAQVPAEFRKAIEKCLLKDPHERYSNVPELLVDLPWPDIAENSENIINRNAIGPIGAQPGLPTNDTQPHPREDAEQQPTLLRHEFNSQPGADIIFGEVQMSSPGTPPDDPIRMIDSQQGNLHLATMATRAGPDESPLVVVDDYTTRAWWRGNLPTPLKLVLLASAGIGSVLWSKWIVAGALVVALGYLVSFIWRAVTSDPAQEKDTRDSAAGADSARIANSTEHDAKLRKHLSLKDFGDRFAELLGSLLIGTVASIAICSLGLLLGDSLTNPNIESIAIVVWAALTSAIGCWGLLGCGKLWESRSGNGWQQRLTTVTLGTLLGGLSYLVAWCLGIQFTDLCVDESFWGAGNLPQLQVSVFAAFVLFFAGLFGFLSWREQVDPVRSVPVSLWLVGSCWVLSVLLSRVFGLHPVWFSIITLAISVSVQIATPWMSPAMRNKTQRSNAI